MCIYGSEQDSWNTSGVVLVECLCEQVELFKIPLGIAELFRIPSGAGGTGFKTQSCAHL